MFTDLKESTIRSVEAVLRDMQTPSYRAGAREAGVAPERLAAEFIVGVLTAPIAPSMKPPRK